MARELNPREYPPIFAIGAKVQFTHNGSLLYGEVIRVYNAKFLYHVQVNEKVYEVCTENGNPDQLQKR